jgi:peroxiredoxin
LPYPLLSDPDFLLRKALNLPVFEADGIRFYRRLTLVIRGRTIEHVFYPVFPPNRHAHQVAEWLHLNPAPA